MISLLCNNVKPRPPQYVIRTGRQRGDGEQFVYLPGRRADVRLWKTPVALREKDAARRLVYHALQHPLYRDVKPSSRVNAHCGPNGASTIWKRSCAAARTWCVYRKPTPAQDVIDIENEILRVKTPAVRTGQYRPVSRRGIAAGYALRNRHASERLIGIALGARYMFATCAPGSSPEGTELLLPGARAILQAARSFVAFRSLRYRLFRRQQR